MKRPAETIAAGSGVGAFLVAVQAHNTLAAIVAGVGLVPGAVTLLVNNGGVVGVARLVARGRKKPPAA